MKIRGWALAAMLAGCAVAQPKPEVKTSAAVLAPMSGLKTYAFDANAPPPPGHAQGPETQAQIAKVKEQIDAAMQAKGYTLSPTPQLLVRISIGLKTIHDPAAVRGASPSTITEQGLEIDVFDHPSGTHLFHGTASDPLRNRQPSESVIAESVPAILGPLPPASG